MNCSRKIRKHCKKVLKRRYMLWAYKPINKQQGFARGLSKMWIGLKLLNPKSIQGSRVGRSIPSQWSGPILTLNNSLESKNLHPRNSSKYKKGQRFRRSQSHCTSKWKCVTKPSLQLKNKRGIKSSFSISINTAAYPKRRNQTLEKRIHTIQGWDREHR